MLNFQDFNVQFLIEFFRTHQNLAAATSFFVVFMEALAVVGFIVPGSITMPAIGFLIGSAVIPAGSTFMWAIAGAIFGDCVSYWLGIHYRNKIHRIWPFTRWPGLLNKAEVFFHKHGGKSVFLGRFIGPARAMIPMVAGVLKMPPSRFLLAAIPSASMWAIAYIMPGVLLGALSLELPPKVAAEFVLWCILAAALLWLVVWLLRHYFKQIYQLIDFYIIHLWKYCKRQKKLAWIVQILSDPKEPDNHAQLTLLFTSLVLVVLFLFVLRQVFDPGILVDFSRIVYYLLASLRTTVLDNVLVVVTMAGDPSLLVVAAVVLFLWLYFKRYYHLARHWIFLVGATGALTTLIKYIIYFPRPGQVTYDLLTSSFPSAHVAMATAFYGFLAVAIAGEFKKTTAKKMIYAIFGFIVSLIAFSRIYLGVHWITDIIGGGLLGLSTMVVVTISYRRQHVTNVRVRSLILAASSIFMAAWCMHSIASFNKSIGKYTLNWPNLVVSIEQLKPGRVLDAKLPLYRNNRFGYPIDVFNLIYVGDAKVMEQVLLNKGWQLHSEAIDIQSIMQNFSSSISVFPQLYHNRRAALFLTKDIDDNTVAVLRFWPSDIKIYGNPAPLWLGSIEYQRRETGEDFFSINRLKVSNGPKFTDGADFMFGLLDKHFRVFKESYPYRLWPTEMLGLAWDGKVLVAIQKSLVHTRK